MGGSHKIQLGPQGSGSQAFDEQIADAVGKRRSEAIEALSLAMDHLSGACRCARMGSSGKTRSLCLRALEMACEAANDEVLQALGHAYGEMSAAREMRHIRDELAVVAAELAALKARVGGAP